MGRGCSWHVLSSGIHAPTLGRRPRAVVVGRPHSSSSPTTIPSPTLVGGAPARAGVRSSREPARALARRYGFDAADRDRGDRERARGRAPPRPRSASRRRPAGSPRRRSRSSCCRCSRRRRFPFAAPAAVWLLAAALSFVDGRLVVVRQRPLPRRDGRRVPARQSARRRPGARRAGDRARLRRRSSCTTTPTTRPATSSSSRAVRDRLAGRLRAARAGRAGRGGRGARRAGRAGARGGGAHRRRRGAGAHRARAPRHRRPRRQRDGAAGRRRPPQAPRDARGGQRGAAAASSRPAARRWPRCASCSARCATTARTLELAPQPGLDGLDALLEEVGRAGLPVPLHVDGEPLRAAAPRSTSRPIASCRRA